ICACTNVTCVVCVLCVLVVDVPLVCCWSPVKSWPQLLVFGWFIFFFSSRRRHTRSVSAFLLTALPILQNETQKEIAGIQSATSRQNTKDQVYAQNEMLAYQQKESTARVASIMENTNLSKQQQV